MYTEGELPTSCCYGPSVYLEEDEEEGERCQNPYAVSVTLCVCVVTVPIGLAISP